ncbi:MAG: polysaccharide biosynthesis C-terminal domain-containing protein [Clostridia bacterium]|nr:polysaccharide biosynthesis C-terminal domain-containing protein [Clostridia bacterium]
MRSKKALMNTAASLILQFVTVICGFIVPRIIIGTYGSEVNGLASSITQFLGYITLFESGVGGVVRAALYKPLAQNDTAKISGIVKATENFFRKIALIFVGYMLVLAGVFPVLVNKSFDWFFTATLVAIIGLSTFAQYYFGMTYTVLTQADQRRYVTATLQIFTIILNAVLVVIFAKLGASVHILKLGTAAVYILRPIILNIYVRRKYRIDRSVGPDTQAIKQRWDGLGHHIAYFVNLNADVVILTLFSKVSAAFSIAEVSVYTVYHAVVYGIVNISGSISSGMEAGFGNMIALNEKENLNKKFGMYEFLSYTIITIMFTCAGILILPFVKVYTGGITDINYIRPAFAFIIVLAYAVFAVRSPYNILTLAAGHYRQTRNGAFAEAAINVAVSIVGVYFWGIVGVALGTLCAMTFRTVQYAWYLSKNILERSFTVFIKRVGTSALSAALSVFVMKLLPEFVIDSYFMWILFGVLTAVVTASVTLLTSLIFSKKELIDTIKYVKSTFLKKVKK